MSIQRNGASHTLFSSDVVGMNHEVILLNNNNNNVFVIYSSGR